MTNERLCAMKCHRDEMFKEINLSAWLCFASFRFVHKHSPPPPPPQHPARVSFTGCTWMQNVLFSSFSAQFF